MLADDACSVTFQWNGSSASSRRVISGVRGNNTSHISIQGLLDTDLLDVFLFTTNAGTYTQVGTTVVATANLTSTDSYTLTTAAQGNNLGLYLERLVDSKWLSPLNTWMSQRIATCWGSSAAVTAAGIPLIGLTDATTNAAFQSAEAGASRLWHGPIYMTTNSTTGVTLNVSPPSGGTSPYVSYLYRSGVYAGTVSGSSVTDTGAAAGITYSYTVTTRDATGLIVTSDTLSLTTLPSSTDYILATWSMPDGTCVTGATSDLIYYTDTGSSLAAISGLTTAVGILKNNLLYLKTAGGSASVVTSQSLDANQPVSMTFTYSGATASSKTIGIGYRFNAATGYSVQFVGQTSEVILYKVNTSFTSITNITPGSVFNSGTYTLTVQPMGAYHSIYVQRAVDGFWLNPSATFQSAQVACIVAHDATYSAAGAMLITYGFAPGDTNAIGVGKIAGGSAVYSFSPGIAGIYATLETSVGVGATVPQGGASPVSYTWQRSTGGAYTSLGSWTINTVNWDNTAVAGTTYNYRIAATDNTGTTVYSNVVTTTTLSNIWSTPSTPSGSTANYLTGATINDVDGNPANLHYGNIIYDYATTLYWAIGSNCNQGYEGPFNIYYSKNKKDWKLSGNAFSAPQTFGAFPAYAAGSYTLSRPKIMYHPTNGLWYAFIHGYNATTAADNCTGVLTSSTGPAGPYTSVAALQYATTGQFDFDIFLDHNGTAYLIYSNPSITQISQLASNWQSYIGTPSPAILNNPEGQGLFRNGAMYYLMGSTQTGFAPNANLAYACPGGSGGPLVGFGVTGTAGSQWTTADSNYSPSTSPFAGTTGGDSPWNSATNYGIHPSLAYNSQTGWIWQTLAGEIVLLADRTTGTNSPLLVSQAWMPITFSSPGLEPQVPFAQTWTPTGS